jgi:hypothetical protein
MARRIKSLEMATKTSPSSVPTFTVGTRVSVPLQQVRTPPSIQVKERERGRGVGEVSRGINSSEDLPAPPLLHLSFPEVLIVRLAEEKVAVERNAAIVYPAMLERVNVDGVFPPKIIIPDLSVS